MNRAKYIFNVPQIEEKCYLLLSCFYGSNYVHEFCGPLEEFGIPNISVLEPGIVTSYLIYVDMQLRMIDDAMKLHGRTHHIPSFGVGLLRWESEQKQWDIREACNKIIHAKSIRILEATKMESPAKTISLSGTKGGSSWDAAIEIEKFIKAALFIVNGWGEDWEVSGYT